MFNQASEAKRFDKHFWLIHAGAGIKRVKNDGFDSNVKAKS